jgi:glycosyltransferase involved in cell wall biosynthesis
MMLELDLSPTLVNQTAMLHICRDAAEALAGLDLRYGYFGETKVQVVGTAGAEADHLRSNFVEFLETAGHGHTVARSSTRNQDVARRIFLDPLYVLFYDLHENDIVTILDMSAVTSPQWHSATVCALYEQAFTRIAAIQPRLIAISENTKDTYHANYGYPRRDILVIPLYVPDHLTNAETTALRIRGDRPYFLFVGSLEARKNIAGAITAFGLSGLARRGYDFVLVGGQGNGFELAEKTAARTPNTVLAGKVSNEDLQSLYAGAAGFIYPSYLEGFGVPLLEALGYGLPAVASITGACPEVGGNLVAYCDPDDHAAIAGQIVKIAEQSPGERAAFAVKAKARATRHFSKAAFQTAFRRAAEDL